MLFYLVLLLAAFCCSDTVALSKISVDPSTGHFVDPEGRVRMFRGINLVEKGSPWYNKNFEDGTRFTQLSELGFNVIRLGTMWTGVEPVESMINYTYVNVIKDMVSSMSSAGVYAVLDMHQDVLWASSYWGVPPWIKAKLPPPSYPFPYPFEEISKWFCGYFAVEVDEGYQGIYDNEGSTAESWASFWRLVAAEFKDQDNVLGYEVINEPFNGNIYADASLLLPGVAGRKNLAPAYERIHAAIRSVDDSTLLFWEPVTTSYFLPYNLDPFYNDLIEDIFARYTMWDFLQLLQPVCGEVMQMPDGINHDLKHLIASILITLRRQQSEDFPAPHQTSTADTPSVFGPGFTQVPGGPDYLNRTVLSYHYYCWAIAYGSDEQYDPKTQQFCQEVMGPSVFSTVQQRATELGGSATMLTEFGLCYPDINIPESENSQECEFVLETAEKHLQSWIYWDTYQGYVFWDDEGNLNEDLVRFFARPYPRATAGEPIRLSFNVYNRKFSYEFAPNPGLTSPTEIFVPELQYPEGSFWVETSNNVRYEVVGSLLVVHVADDGDRDVAVVKIHPTAGLD